jgi:hypothetical protein
MTNWRRCIVYFQAAWMGASHGDFSHPTLVTLLLKIAEVSHKQLQGASVSFDVDMICTIAFAAMQRFSALGLSAICGWFVGKQICCSML